MHGAGWSVLGGWLLLLAAAWLASGCSLRAMATPLPEDYLPTAIAQTLEASGVLKTPVALPTQAALPPADALPTGLVTNTPVEAAPTLENTPAPAERPSDTPALPSPTATPFALLPPPPTPTLPVGVPAARIQVFRLGELSKVRSPLQFSLVINRFAVGPLRVELFGEDGRLLVRQLKALPTDFSGQSTEIAFKLDFEIRATAEVGRLVLTTQDAFGRLLAINSVNLILMSIGEAELNPPTALYERLYIQQPERKALIQGGKLLISGLALPDTDKPLRVQVVTEEGRVVGQRLAGVTRHPDGGYSPFAVEVPYNVLALTPARLIVYEDGGAISPVAHLASVEVVLSP
jgi:hypothetical protein